MYEWSHMNWTYIYVQAHMYMHVKMKELWAKTIEMEQNNSKHVLFWFDFDKLDNVTSASISQWDLGS